MEKHSPLSTLIPRLAHRLLDLAKLQDDEGICSVIASILGGLPLDPLSFQVRRMHSISASLPLHAAEESARTRRKQQLDAKPGRHAKLHGE